MLLRPAFTGCDVTFVTTIAGLPEEQKIAQFKIVSDCNKNEPKNIVTCAWQMFKIYRKVTPDVIISTGAAPGVLGLAIGKIFGKKTIWVDSIANAQELSLGGKLSKNFAHTVLTQWPDVAEGKVQHAGAIF